MSRHVTDEQRIEEYFRTKPEAEVRAMADKVALMVRFRGIDTPKERKRKTSAVKLKEPEAKP